MHPAGVISATTTNVVAGIHSNAILVVEAKSNRTHGAAGRNHQVVLDVSSTRVNHRVDARQGLGRASPVAERHTGTPAAWIVSSKIISVRGQHAVGFPSQFLPGTLRTQRQAPAVAGSRR